MYNAAGQSRLAIHLHDASRIPLRCAGQDVTVTQTWVARAHLRTMAVGQGVHVTQGVRAGRPNIRRVRASVSVSPIRSVPSHATKTTPQANDSVLPSPMLPAATNTTRRAKLPVTPKACMPAAQSTGATA